MIFEDIKLEGRSTEEVLEEFIDFVTKTDDEVVKEGVKKRKSTTELKIYVASNRGFSIENLDQEIEDIVTANDVNDNPKHFFESHTFTVHPINDEASLLEIETLKYNRTDEFLVIDDEDYIKVLTVVRKNIAESTIEKLIQYLPHLDRIFLSSDDLRGMVEEYEKRSLSGFTAKYEPFFKEEYISVQVHGGSHDHLEKVQDDFDARPKRVVFSRKNSPSEAVKGTVSQDGYASIPRVREGSRSVGLEEIETVVESCEERDRQNFEVEHRPERLTPGDHYFLTQLTLEEASSEEKTDGGLSEVLQAADQGSVIDGLTLCIFEEEVTDQEYPDDNAVAESLEEKILEYKQRYRYSEIGQNNFLVYDGERGQSFEIVINNKDLKVYSRSNTTEAGLRDFYEIIDGEFNASYKINKTSKRVRA